MNGAGTGRLLSAMREFADGFGDLADRYDGTSRDRGRLTGLVADFSAFVTDARHHDAWDALVRAGDPGFLGLAGELRARSARAASIMEKHRALGLLDGNPEPAGYFDDVESVIADEAGPFPVTRASAVLLVGAGAFPMAPLRIARGTGAAVVGIDTDPEAVALGREVVRTLGPDLDITLDGRPAEALPFTRTASHVIFSSTVAAKYRILDALHPVTRDDVVVVMRFGDHLKSLFNYPRAEVDPDRWRPHDVAAHPARLFDVARYTKAGTGAQR